MKARSTSEMLGVGKESGTVCSVKESGTVCSFKALKSVAQRTEPSFFMTRGDTQALAEGAMIPSSLPVVSSRFLPVLGSGVWISV